MSVGETAVINISFTLFACSKPRVLELHGSLKKTRNKTVQNS